MTTKAKKVAVVYYSGSGHTHLMAEAVARGAKAVPGVEVVSHRILGEQIEQGRWKDDAVLKSLADADAIIFGTATYMGGVAAQFKAFADGTGGVWFGRGWKGKLAGGFTHSGSPSGDKQVSLQYLATLAAQHAMLWVNYPEVPHFYTGRTDGINRFGFYLGAAGAAPMQHGAPAAMAPEDVVTAEAYGRHVAECALRWGG